jgi:acetyl esterase/lipase
MRIFCGIFMLAVIAGCASMPSPQTVQVPSAVPAQIAAELLKIGPIVAPPPTEKLYAPLAEREPYAGVQVRRDVRYGADARNLLDVFTPDKPQASQPVLVFVHGGGFMRGERRTGDSPFYDNIMLWAVRENIAASGGNPQRIILMGHSAGAAHVAQYVGHPQFHVVPGSGLAGAILLSGLFDPVTAESNPPLQAYFGKDAAQYPARSAVPGLVAAKVPLLLAYAELDPPDFHTQSEQLNAALCKAGQCPGLYKLMGHSHMSEIYSINSADKTVGNLMKQLVDRVR